MRRFLAILCTLFILCCGLTLAVYATDGAYTHTEVLERDLEDLSIASGSLLDLNGYSVEILTVVGDDPVLYCIDSATDDYTVADGVYGKIANVAEGALLPGDGYMQVAEADGVSFHRVNLEIGAMTLRPDVAGVYYTSDFAGDEVVKANVESYGVALSLMSKPTPGEAGCGYSSFSDFQAGADANAAASGTLLKNILKTTNLDAINARNANLAVYGRAYLKTAEGYVFGATVSRSLKTQVEAVNEEMGTLGTEQKDAAYAMYETYSSLMADWDIADIISWPEVKNQPVVKFVNKFVNDYLYRVGNGNAVTLGNLFGAAEVVDDKVINVSGVTVTAEPLNETSAVSGTVTANTSDWTKSAIQFSGTGLAKITIKDDDRCIPTELIVEVVAANNYPSATSGASLNATANDVVLLANVGSTGFTVSGGHTFYGNGFKVTCSGKGTYLNQGGMSRGYAHVETGGVLDNTQVICDIYPNAFVYASEVTKSSNLDTAASTEDKSRYMYQLSAIAVSGDGSKVSNCYAYGGRNNIYIGVGNVSVVNTVTECGTLANIQVKSTDAYSVILKDVTTIQHQTTSTYDSVTMLGFGILVGDNESASNPKLVIQNSLTQYNWVTEADTNISNQYAKQAITSALTFAAYQHTTPNGDNTVNTGIIYLNDKTAAIDDQRASHNYVLNTVTMNMKDPTTGLSGNVEAQVYSVSNGSYAEILDEDYVPNTQGDVLPTVVFDLADQAVTGENRYLTGNINGIEARFEEGQEAFTLDITKLMQVSKHGIALPVTAACLDSNGNALTVTDGKVTLDKTENYTFVFTVEDDIIFSPTGEKTGESITRTYTVPVALTVAEPAIADATITITNFSPIGSYCDASLDGSKNMKINPLSAISVTDAGTAFTLTSNVSSTNIAYSNSNAFSGTTTITVNYTTGQVLTFVLAKPNSNAPGTKTINYSNDGTVKTAGQFAKNSCTAATWTVNSYSFKGINGKTITSGGVTFTIAADTSGGGCVTGDTLVTLADGTQKRTDQITDTDLLLAWDFVSGRYVSAPASIIENHGYGRNTVIKLTFEDGTVVKAVNVHGFFNADLNRWVDITENNAHSFIGDHFTQMDGSSYKAVKLVSVDVWEEYIEAWGILTADYYNCITEGMFSIVPPATEQLAYFEIGENMTYDEEQMLADIEKYGLYTYGEFEHLMTYEAFEAFNVPQIKIAVGKGLITYEEVIALILKYA